MKQTHLTYSICFLEKDNHMLLVKRVKMPWLGRWNGLGGKLETGETPRENVVREIFEETDLDISREDIRYTGIVTWITEKTGQKDGMYAFIVHLTQNVDITEKRETREGLLAWKALDWIIDKSNPDIAHNIPYFLPQMLNNTQLHEYFCSFDPKPTVTEFPHPGTFTI